jgi:hypothetical protein
MSGEREAKNERAHRAPRIVLDDTQYRIAIAIGVGLLVLAVSYLRFCYHLGLPPKPRRPELRDVRVEEVLDTVGKSPLTYTGFLESDSAGIGVRAVSTDEIARVLPYQIDTHHHTLTPDSGSGSTIETLGLRLTLSVQRSGGDATMLLTIENTTSSDLAYDVATEPNHGTAICHQKKAVAHNAMVVAAHGAETRSECIYKHGFALTVTKVQTIALPPLSSYYVSSLPPAAAGLEPRLAKGARALLPVGRQPCNVTLAQSVRAALDRGTTTWRDIIDYYARHRCETYRFPEGYKAFDRDGEHPLPITD